MDGSESLPPRGRQDGEGGGYREGAAEGESVADAYMHAMDVLSTAVDADTQQEAQQFMLAAQEGDAGWVLAYALLGRRDNVCAFFGARILASKVVRDWDGLTGEERAHVQGVVFQAIHDFDSGPINVLTRLCVTFAAILLRSCDDFSGVIQHIVNELAPSPTALVQIITILPEELQRAFLAPDTKISVRAEIKASGRAVLATLNDLLVHESASAAFQRKVLYAYLAWIESADLPVADLLDTPLVGHAFSALSTPDLLRVAVDVIEALILTPKGGAHRDVMEAMVSSLLALDDAADAALEAGEFDVIKGLGRLVAALIEAELPWLLSDDVLDAFLMLINIPLRCVASPKRSALELTVQGWGDLADALIAAAPSARQRLSPDAPRCVREFVPVFVTLVSLVLERTRLPLDWESLDSFDTHYWQLVRRDCADTFEAACKLLGPEAYFSSAFDYLQSQLEEAPWREVEAGLFAIRVVAIYLPRPAATDGGGGGGGDGTDSSSEYEDITYAGNVKGVLQARGAPAHPQVPQSQYLANVLGLFEYLPDHPRVTKSAIKLLGAFAGRIGPLAPDAMTMVLQHIDDPYLQASAATSLRELCSQCGVYLVPVLDQMVAAVTSVLDALPARPRLLALESLGHVIACASHAQASEALQYLATPLVQRLHGTLDALAYEAAPELQPLTASIHLLTACCRFVDVPGTEAEHPPVMHVLEAAWPDMARAFEYAPHDAEVMAATTQFVSAILRAVRTGFAPALPDVLSTVAPVYAAAPSYAILALVETIISLLSKTEALESLLPSFLESIVRSTLAMFEESENAVSQAPDVVGGFFSVLLAVLSRHPSALFACGALHSVFHAGVLALHSKEKIAMSNVLRFLESFFGFDAPVRLAEAANQLIEQAFDAYGETLVDFALQALGGALPRSLETRVSNMLFALNFRFPDPTQGIVSHYFTAPGPDPYPSPNATEVSKTAFLAALAAARVPSRFRNAIRSICMEWRGLLNQPYGAPI